MKIFYTDGFVLPLPPGHRFPMRKYSALRERIVADGLAAQHDLVVPDAATDEELQLVHSIGYVRAVQEGTLTSAAIRRIGFPWSPAMVERSRRSVGATIGAARAALADGVGVNLAGGTHHAFTDRGEGFCVFNDVAVAVRVLMAARRARRVAIIDTDVHQGNGTAAIFAGEADVFTFSVHGAGNFPFRKERSDLDIALPDGAGDDAYLAAVQRGLDAALAAGADVVFHVAGADPFVGDRLGRLAVSKTALAARDELVLRYAARAGAALVVVMGGGYAVDVNDTVDIHFHTVRAAASFVAARSETATSR